MLQITPPRFTLYPLIWLAICFASGILTSNFLNLDWRIYFLFCLLFAIFSIIFLSKKVFLILVSVTFIFAGALYSQIEIQSVAENRIKNIYDGNRINSGEPVEIEGIIEGEPELAAAGFFITLKTEKIIYKNSELSVSGNVRLFAPVQSPQIRLEYEQLNLHYGSQIRVACNLKRTENFLNAGGASNKQLLDQKRIDATGMIKSSLLVEKTGETPVFIPLAWLYQRRRNLIDEFNNNFSVSTAGVLIASLLGNGNFLDKSTAEVFREGGTFHVLVISGLHITFIGGLTLLFVQFFTNRRLWQFLIASGFLWAYSLAVGAEVPVIRATIMFTILLFSQVIYRSGTLLNALGLCALILLAWRPSDIFTQSFQLTFVSVTAIVACAFPLIEKLRAIGSWTPNSEQPFPPDVSFNLKRFCEWLYWREEIWERETSRQTWTANLFKTTHLKWFKSQAQQNFIRYIFEAILVSLIVQTLLLPLLVVYFHRLSPISILANLWVGVIIALESFSAILAIFLAQISNLLALPVIKLTEALNWLLISIPGFFTDNSWSNFRVPIYSGWLKAIDILYFIPVILLVVSLNSWNPFVLVSKNKFHFWIFRISKFRLIQIAVITLSVLFAVIVFHPYSSPRLDGRLKIDFLDVGQGDSALISFPNGETMLIDGGGKRVFDRLNLGTESDPDIFEPDLGRIGERVVSEFLWENGYSQVDYILATHADADHIQGLTDVAKNFKVKTALFGRTPIDNVEFRELNSILKKRGIESKIVSRGDVLIFDQVRIEVLYPLRDDSEQTVSDNNHSLVLRVAYGNRKFLLTGDIEKESEKVLASSPEFLQTDVIKVAHHGSKTSSTMDFIKATRAKIAIIPIGIESPFGHPHKDVLERWKSEGAQVLTTGENGTITISTDGKDSQMETFKGEKIFR